MEPSWTVFLAARSMFGGHVNNYCDTRGLSDRPDITEELKNDTLKAGTVMKNSLAMGGSPDATPTPSQRTILCANFEICARNKSTRTVLTLWEALGGKGWSDSFARVMRAVLRALA